MRRSLSRNLWILALVVLPGILSAQKQPAKKDTIRLSCILRDAVIQEPEKAAIDMGKELKLILSSATDTVVRAGIDGVVSTIRRDEEGKWEVVFYHNDYWFWMSGIETVSVKKNQRIKKGDPIGINQTGTRIELLMYDFETPIDPAKYLDCP